MIRRSRRSRRGSRIRSRRRSRSRPLGQSLVLVFIASAGPFSGDCRGGMGVSFFLRERVRSNPHSGFADAKSPVQLNGCRDLKVERRRSNKRPQDQKVEEAEEEASKTRGSEGRSRRRSIKDDRIRRSERREATKDQRIRRSKKKQKLLPLRRI